MAADFPATKKTFTQIVDGTDYTEATQVNQAYDEAEAIETFIGAMGRSQSYNTSLKAMLKNFRNGCSCVPNSATQITVQTGEISIPDTSGNLAYRQNTSAVTVTWAMLDTGSEATSTMYYVYAVADSAATTFTVTVSANATTPTGPAYYRKIGSFYNNAAGDITTVSDVSSQSSLGAWVDKSASYGAQQATTDGEVQVYLDATDGGAYKVIAQGYTDGVADPATIRAACTFLFVPGYTERGYSSFTMKVRKGDYWKVVKTESGTGTLNAFNVYWIPTGT